MNSLRRILGFIIAIIGGILSVSSQADPYRVYFSSDRDTGTNWQLYRMSAGGHDIQRLTNTNTYDYAAAVSPDDTQIAFTRRNDGGYTEIYLAPINNLQDATLLVRGDSPTWSPDSERIAYTFTSGAAVDIYMIDASGFNNTQITTHPAKDYAPAWSPDGTRIAFKSQREPSQPTGLYTVYPDRTTLTRWTDTDRTHHAPSWSPDGAQIAFTRQVGPGYAIHIITLPDGVTQRLTGETASEISPHFTPGGDLLFVSVTGQYPDLYRMAADGTNRARLTDSPAWDWLPTSGS